MSFTGVFQKAFVSSLLETKMTERKPLRSSTCCLLTSCCLDGVFTWYKASGGSAGKESTCNAGDQGSIPGLGRSPWRREWQPTTPVFLPGRIPRTEAPGGLSSMGSQRVRHKSDMTEQLTLSLLLELRIFKLSSKCPSHWLIIHMFLTLEP